MSIVLLGCTTGLGCAAERMLGTWTMKVWRDAVSDLPDDGDHAIT
jgi:hypothetical protein